jgi:hypothetical protein
MGDTGKGETKVLSRYLKKAALPLANYAAGRILVTSRSRSWMSRLRRPASPASPASPKMPIQPQLWSFRGASSVRVAVGALASWRSVALAGLSAAWPNASVAARQKAANRESSLLIKISASSERWCPVIYFRSMLARPDIQTNNRVFPRSKLAVSA